VWRIFVLGGNKMRLLGEQNETGAVPSKRAGTFRPQGQALRRPERSGGRRKAWPCGRRRGSMRRLQKHQLAKRLTLEFLHQRSTLFKPWRGGP